jgi:iron complex outermembrane receptor protein
LLISVLLLSSGIAAAAGPDSPTPSDPPLQAGAGSPQSEVQQDTQNDKDEAQYLGVISASAYVPEVANAASKSRVPLLETPQSVSVISRAQINLLDWQNLGQAMRYTSVTNGDSFGADARYDWIQQRGFNPAVYINGLRAPIGSVKSTGIDLFGFQSVEVLKGPSSALYGSAPPGGIVNLTSRRPQMAPEGQVQLQYGTYATKQATLDMTGPIGDDFLGRLTMLYNTGGTQRHDVDTDRYYIAPAFTWRPSDDTTFTFLSYFQHDEITGDGAGFLPAYGVLLPNPIGEVPTSTNLGDTQYNNFKRDQYGIGYEFTHSLNDTWKFQQNTMYFNNKSNKLEVYGTGLLTDSSGVPVDYRTVTRANFPFNEAVRAFEMDSRMYGTFDTGNVNQNLIFGLTLRHYDDDAVFGFAAAPPIDLFDPVYGKPITTPPLDTTFLQQVQKNAGLYVQDVVEMNHWVVTAGGREDYLDTSNSGVTDINHRFSYHAGLNYVTDSGLAPYVSYATSFQPVSGADYAGKAFSPTVGDQTEVGVKFQPTSLSPGSNLSVSLAAYQLNQKNVLTPDPDHPLFSVQTGAVRVKGIELEGVARFNESLSLNFAYTTMNSEVTESNGPDLGKQLPVTPRHSGSALVDYTVPTGILAQFGASLGFRYTGPSYGDPANTLQAPGHTIWDATVHYAFADWKIDLSASNIFDKKYTARCTSVTACYYGYRRAINLTVARRF